MAPEKSIGRVVFIGNIPYGKFMGKQGKCLTNTCLGVSEEQIVDIFQRVGAVNGFRLVHDKETGRPKGFGFLEYADQDNAAAAVRNLNDFDIMGRKLRVDWSNESSSGVSGGTGGSGGADGSQYQGATGSDAQGTTALPPLPQGTENTNPNLTVPNAISATLHAMQAPQLLDVISQMKGMVTENHAQVTQLFTVAPQLAYAIFQALILLNLTEPNVLSTIVQTAAAPQNNAQYGQPQQPPPQQQFTPAPASNYQFHPSHVATPPVQQTPYQPPAPPQPAGQPDQAALIQQVIAMTPQQIFALPAAQRDQIIQIRAQLGAPVG